MDPFWEAVHRRHPDVDLVLLRPEAPAAADEPGDEQGVDALRDRVEAAAARLWPDATGAEPPPARLAYGARPDTVVVRVKGSARLAAAPALDAPADPGVHLTASYAEATGTLLLTLTSDPVPVGVDRARELVRGARAG